MAKKRHLYRRGNQYWFRVSVTVAHRQRLDVRFSLRTDSLFVASRLCSILEGELTRIEAEVQQVFELFSKRKVAGSNPSVPMSKIRLLVEEHFKQVLDDAHRKRREMGLTDWPDDTKAEAVAKSDYIDLLLGVEARRTSVDLQRAETWLHAQIAAGRLTVERANAARQMLKARLSSGDTYPTPKTQRDWIPYKARIEFSSDDLLQLDILMLIAERELLAKIAGDWRIASQQQGHAPASPPSLQSESHPVDWNHGGMPAPAEEDGGPHGQTSTAGTLPAANHNDAAIPPAPAPTPPLQPASHLASAQPDHGISIKAAIEEFLDGLQAEHDGKYKSHRQVRAMGNVLMHVIGGPDTPTSQLTQFHLGLFVKTLRKMPTVWGRSPKEQEAAGVAVALERAKELEPEKVGLSPQTEGRHLTYLGTFLNFCADQGYVATGLKVDGLRSQRAKQREQQKQIRGRENWIAEEFDRLLDAPPFSGSAGPSRSKRYKSGNAFYSDSAYWMPLILLLHGFRSAEAAGIPVAHVKLDRPIPIFSIEPTDDRGVKTVSSIREVPIHPELLRLGFAEFVDAVTKTGHQHLFPDLIPSSESGTPASLYYKSFIYLRRWAFPEGTSSKMVRGGNEQDKDVHSIRGFTITMLEESGCSPKLVSQIVGHHKDPNSPHVPTMSPMTRRYLTPATLQQMLSAMAVLTPITQRLQPVPLKLNPLIYKK